MSTFRTGETIYELILSVDVDNNPVTGATFDNTIFKDGVEFTGITISETLTDATNGLFSFSFSSDTTGTYQMHVKNNSTNVLFVSDQYFIKPASEFDTTVYVGL